jgi:DNA polymerase-3 subunit delta'
MLDDYQKEQPIIYKTLLNAISKNTVTHAYLIELNGYSKGLDFALSFAKYLLCPHHYSNSLNCGDCHQCMTIDDGNFLEIKVIHPDGQWIKKEQLEELQQEFNRKALVGNQKIYIIDGADKLNTSSANSILKFLEEPVAGITAILLVDNAYQVMSTIVSRCQILSLKQENHHFQEEIDTKTLLAYYSFHQQEEIDEFLNNDDTEPKIDMMIDYIQMLEKNGYQAIIYKNKPFLEKFNDKKLLFLVFQWFILYYKDVLNKKCNKNLEFFKDYSESIEFVAQKNSVLSLCKKLEILLDLSEKIKFNVNATMLMDKLVIDLMEVEK